MNEDTPYGYVKTITVEVTPKPAPPPSQHGVWHIGAITSKMTPAVPTGTTGPSGRITVTMQLTADQQVALSITGEDAYDNVVPITGDIAWLSSDETIITVAVDSADNQKAIATAVGPTGTASVTVTNDQDRDGTGDFMGSLAIDVVVGEIAEIVINADEPTDKPA
jgi:hypothetical protein